VNAARRPTRSLRAAVLALAAATGLACVEPEPGDFVSGPELRDALRSDAPPLVLDVRTPAEFRQGHVPGARNVPHDGLAARLSSLELPDERQVVVYCERGGRAQAAERILRDAGFERVRRLEGDMRAWRAAGLPCEGC